MLDQIKSNPELKEKFGNYLKENYGERLVNASKEYSKAMYNMMVECANNFADAEGLDKSSVNDDVAGVIEQIYKVKKEAVSNFFDEMK